MYAEVLRAIAGIEVFPVFSLVLFVAFFAVVLIRAWRLDRDELNAFAAMPLDQAGDTSGNPRPCGRTQTALSLPGSDHGATT